MKKVRQTRLFSVALIVMFLATSTLTRVVAGNDAGEFEGSYSLHTHSDAPYSSDQQFPFEEKEKEFEDKSESSDKVNQFASNFFFICEITCPSPDVASDFDGIFFFNSGTSIASLPVPLFLGNRSLLI